MITRNSLRAIALATSCLVPLAALAADPTQPAAAPASASGASVGGLPFTGEIQFGLMGVSGTNPDQFGRYNGLNTTGLDTVGQFDLGYRAPWDSGGTRYYEINGDNLVFQTGNRLGSGVGNGNGWGGTTSNSLTNNGSLGFKAGDQGIWGLGAYYDAITYTGNVIDSLYTVNGSQAFLNPGLINYGGASINAKGPITTAYTLNSLAATHAMQPVQVGTRRDIFGGNFKYIWGDWTFSAAIRHEHKEGSMEESFKGSFSGSAFAMPIDYDTDRYDATAAYNTRLFQGILTYTFSHFTDNNSYVSLPNVTSGSAVPFQMGAAYALPPSNSAHYVTLMLASNIVPHTRLNLNARVGLEKQDDTFPPGTGDLGLTPNQLSNAGLNSNLQGTNGTSPDITATVYQLKLSASSNPIPRVDARVYYGLDGRSVHINQYAVNGSGSGSDTSLGGLAYAYVVPQNWFKQNAGGEVGYRLIPEYNTRVTVGYRLDATERSNAQVGNSWTNTGSVALSSDLGPKVDGRLSFDYVSRSGSLSYLTPWLNLDGPGASQTYSGAYYQAPMTSEAVTLRADYTPMNELTSSLFLQFKNENYTYPGIPLIAGSTAASIPLTGVGGGVKQDYILSLGPDINYRPRENLNFHFFYTYERLLYNNIGNGACSSATQAATALCTGTAGYFQNQDTSSTHTVGVSGDWKVNAKLRLKADYTLSYGSVMFTQFNGVFVPVATQSYQNVTNYPDINSLMNSVRVTATYELTPNTDVVLMGSYTNFHNNSWYDNASAIQGAGTSAVSILTPGYGSPNWNIVTAMAGVRFRF